MPLVSVFLTSYNHAKYLREAIDSVLAQTFTDFELIIWDDASTDNSWEIIQSYTDPRIKAYKSQATQRVVPHFKYSFDTGIISGKYIALHHSDDVWESEKLSRQLEAFKNNPQVGVVFTAVKVVDENGGPFKDQSNYYCNVFEQPNRNRHEWLRFFLLHNNALCHPSVLFDREVFEKNGLYSHCFPGLGDFEFWVRICRNTEIFIVQERLTIFRIRDGESNSSARTGVVHRYYQTNFYHILEHYLEIDDFGEIVKIFPEAERFDRGPHTNTKFIWAQLFLLFRPNTPTVFKAIETIFELLQGVETAAGLAKYYNFTPPDYAKLLAMFDIFNGNFMPPQREVRQIGRNSNVAAPEKTTKSCFCRLCGNRFERYLPLEHSCSDLIEQLDNYGYDAKALKPEFYNRDLMFCPACMGMDRDRLVAEYLFRRLGAGFVDPAFKLVEFAPREQLGAFIKRAFNITHVTADLFMDRVDYNADLTNMPEFATDSVDAWLCIHMLEHIPDDAAALRELWRILKPGGFGILLAPISLALKQTDEDPGASLTERWRRFGQDDHIRLYARNDFIRRVQDAGFKLTQLGMNWFGAECYEKLGLPKRAVLYVAEK